MKHNGEYESFDEQNAQEIEYATQLNNQKASINDDLLEHFPQEQIEGLLVLETFADIISTKIKETKAQLQEYCQERFDKGEKIAIDNNIVIQKTSPSMMQESDILKEVEKAQEKLALANQKLLKFRESGEIIEKSKPQIKITIKKNSLGEMIIKNDAEKLLNSMVNRNKKLKYFQINN